MKNESETPSSCEFRRDVNISIASWEPSSVVNGPGERFVLWLQGCPFRCPACFNQEFLSFTNDRMINVGQLAELVLSVGTNEGITYSGGEPMAQAHGLSLLTEILRTNGMSVVCYTGYTLAELEGKHDRWINRFIQQIDVLIDGRFEIEQQALLPWRGSRNQVVHFLTKRYEGIAARLSREVRETAMELVINSSGYRATGIISHELLAELDSAIHEGKR